MPPFSSKEKIPNLPINGWELAVYVRTLLKTEIEQRGVLDDVQTTAVVDAMAAAMQNDYFFLPTYTYPNVEFTLGLQCHKIEQRFAFDLSAQFKTVNPLAPEHTPFIRKPIGLTSPPLEHIRPDDEHEIDCFLLMAQVNNPNLVRVHHNLPIVMYSKKPPAFGQLVADIEKHEVYYDKTDYPEELPPPTITDETAVYAAKWGITRYSGPISRIDMPRIEQTATAFLEAAAPSPEEPLSAAYATYTPPPPPPHAEIAPYTQPPSVEPKPKQRTRKPRHEAAVD